MNLLIYQVDIKKIVIISYSFLFLVLSNIVCAQSDSSLNIGKRVVTLKEVVVRNNLNVPNFIERVKNDTSFYKAFKNLKVLGYTSLNDVRMRGRKDKDIATLQSKTMQVVKDGCRSTLVLKEQVTGNIYDKNKNWNYYTLELYAGLFFAKGSVCGENNIVKGTELSIKDKSGMAKHKEQLKMLFFNPGKNIPGIPFIGNKIAIFDDEISNLYDFIIDMADYQGQQCYIFTIKPRADLTKGQKNDIVINEMTTWFNSRTMEIVARNYDLSYNAGVYDFDVHMEVEMEKFGEFLVPKVIRYSGNWHAIFNKREKAVFTATLFDFKK